MSVDEALAMLAELEAGPQRLKFARSVLESLYESAYADATFDAVHGAA